MAALTAVSGYVHFRWEAITARSERHGGKPYGPGEEALALLAFVFSVMATLAVVVLAVLKRKGGWVLGSARFLAHVLERGSTAPGSFGHPTGA